MSDFQAHVARLARAAETAAREVEQKPQPVAVALNESAQSLPPHIIAATDPYKLNKQAPIFRCPAWAGLPPRPYHLHCERGGVPFPALALHRFPYYLFGKNDVCDYVLEHPSVSSVHAALIYNKEHDCYVLLDLGSTNGTRLQGKRVEPRKPVPIAVGNVLQFGYSTRSYELRAGAAAAVKRSRDDVNASEAEVHGSAAGQPKTEGKIERQGLASSAATAMVGASASGAATSRGTEEARASSTAELPPSSQMLAHESSAAPPTSSSSLPSSPPVEAPGNAESTKIPAPAVDDLKAEPVPDHAVDPAVSVPPPAAIHLYQLVIKHKDVDNPVSRGHNKGEVITRSKADALDMVRFIVQSHAAEVPVDAALGFSPWTVEQFVAAVREYCEVSSKKKAGDLGMVEKGTFSDVIDEAAFRLRRGEVSAPVETQLGVHLLYRCD